MRVVYGCGPNSCIRCCVFISFMIEFSVWLLVHVILMDDEVIVVMLDMFLLCNLRFCLIV